MASVPEQMPNAPPAVNAPAAEDANSQAAGRESSARSWEHAAVSLAVVGVVLLGFVLFRYRKHQDPLDNPAYKALKEQIAQAPKDEAAKARLRALDLALRQSFFDRRNRTVVGGLLLLGIGAAFVAAFKLRDRYRYGGEAYVSVPPTGEIPDAYSVDAPRARVALAVAGLAFVATGWALAVSAPEPPVTDTGQETVDAPTARFPTMDEWARQWPRFRGSDGSGVSPFGSAPTKWDAEKGEGILWKVPIPLPGNGSPVVWNDRIFLTGSDGKAREVYAFDARTGMTLWRTRLDIRPARILQLYTADDLTTSYAPATVVADGERVYAMFSSGEMACLNAETGAVRWTRDLGPLEISYGYASSPAYHEGRLIIQLDQGMEGENKGALLALDALTGKTVWRTPRPGGSSWATPIVVGTPEGVRIFCAGDPVVGAYDFETGREIWRASLLAPDIASSPVYSASHGGRLFATHATTGLFALRTDGTGDVTETHVVWRGQDGVPEISSPVTDGERIYVVTGSGILTCYETASGKKLWEHDCGDACVSSPTIAGGLVYVTLQTGDTIILKAASTLTPVSRGRVGEKVYASLAFAPGRIFIRGETYLFAIGANPQGAAP